MKGEVAELYPRFVRTFIEPHLPAYRMAHRYINPLTDFGFKRLFGEELNKDILIAFLNDLLPLESDIADLTYGKNERLGNTEVDRKAIYDLYCRSENGERFIVELQKAKQNFFKDRSVFYSSFPIQEQAKKGDWDFRLDAVYTIGILDFVFNEHKNDTDYLHLVELKDQRNAVFYDKLKYVYVELPKFQKEADELTSNIDKWLYVFRHLSRLDERPPALRERVFEKVFTIAEISNFSPGEREAYEDSLKYYRDLNNVVQTSFEEGREEGFAEGREEGRAEGQREMAERTARSLLQLGLTTNQISEATGLPPEDVENLRAK